MLHEGKEYAHAFDSALTFKEVTAPGTPPTNYLRFYAKDKAGVSALYLKDDAGSEREIGPANQVTGTGAANKVAYWTSSSVISSDTDLHWDPVNNDLAIGNAGNPSATLVGRGLSLTKTAVTAELNIFGYSGTGFQAGIRMFKPRSTPGSETATQANDGTFLAFGGHTGSAFNFGSGQLLFLATSNWTPTSTESEIRLLTTPNASTTSTERFRIGSAGQLGIGGATFGSAGQYFRSAGASAAPTWATIDHGSEITGLLDDDHTQYALLAGRSGGQTLIGGTAASEDLTLKATAHATIGTVIIAEQPLGLSERTLRLGSDTGWLTGLIPASLNIAGTIASTSESHGALLVDTRFTGAGNNPIGSAVLPYINPSASISAALGGNFIPQVDPQTGVTITTIAAFNCRLDYIGSDGAVTTGQGCRIDAPTASGTLKPTTQQGILIQNQGLTGITNAVALSIAAQSGATNNYVFELPNDTGAVGTTYGRIPVLITGVGLKYIELRNV